MKIWLKMELNDPPLSEFIIQVAKELDIEFQQGLAGRELELIALVRNCPLLYDRTMDDFKNIEKKNEAWAAIAQVFGIAVNDVQTKWKSMRDNYARCKRAANSGDTGKLCPHYDDLEFLEPFIQTRRARIGGTIPVDKDKYIDPLSDSSLTDTKPVDTLHFISCIRALPALYHSKYRQVSHKSLKIGQWRQLARNVGMPAKECILRWKNLRERYSRERRSSETTKWRYFNHLKFLDPHIKKRRSYKSSCGSRNESEIDDDTDSTDIKPFRNSTDDLGLINEDFLNDVNVITTNKSEQINSVAFFDVSHVNGDFVCLQVGKQQENENEQEQQVVEEEEQQQQHDEQPSDVKDKDLDEDELFGQTITAELRRLTDHKQKIKLKAEIYKLLYQNCCE